MSVHFTLVTIGMLLIDLVNDAAIVVCKVVRLDLLREQSVLDWLV